MRPVVYERLTQRLTDIDLGLAQSVSEMVGGRKPEKANTANHGKKTRGLSQLEYLPEKPIVASRRIGILISDGYDPVAFNAIYQALKAAKTIPLVIGRRRSAIYAEGEDSSKSKGVVPDHHLEGQRSTMFDALVIPGGKNSVTTLSANGRSLHYIREAFGHLKPIAATGEAVGLVEKALQLKQVSLSADHEAHESYGVVTLKDAKPESLKQTVELAKNAKGFLDKFLYSVSQHRVWDRELDGLSMMVAY